MGRRNGETDEFESCNSIGERNAAHDSGGRARVYPYTGDEEAVDDSTLTDSIRSGKTVPAALTLQGITELPMRQHHYAGPQDFYRAQAALMRWIKQRGHCNYLHKGDIGHRLYNNCYGYDKSDIFRYWLDDAGELAAFATLLPQWQSFELQVAPAYLLGRAHCLLLETCERETLRLGEKLGRSITELIVEVEDCESAFMRFIEACGYARGEHLFSFTRHDLSRLPEAPLPPGFRFRQATAADAEMLADVHNHSFTNKWDADSYGEVFRSPHMEYELVVIAPDGRCAAFTNVWVDTVNQSLLFEPVGAHADFRRRGLAKALMTYALRRMRRERGIKCAYVGHEPAAKNPASGPLYAAVGFKHVFDCYAFKKSV